jgi:hypothetical protein
MRNRLPETNGLITGWVLGRDMKLKIYQMVCQEWANLSDGRLSEYGGCIQVREAALRTHPGGYIRIFDQGYPMAKKVWNGARAIKVIFQATFPAGVLKKGGINEAYLINGTARNFAHARLDPMEVVEEDTLRIQWEITVRREDMTFFPGLRKWVRGLPGLSGERKRKHKGKNVEEVIM